MMLRIGSKNTRYYEERVARHCEGAKQSQKRDCFASSRLAMTVAATTKAFTLVEVMISVVILGFGLCIIIQSFISAIRGLDSCQNYIQSLRFAQDKMNDLITESYEKKGLFPGAKAGEIVLGNRKFSWQVEIEKISKLKYLTKDFVMVAVNLGWQERGISKNSTLVTYLPKNKEEEKTNEPKN